MDKIKISLIIVILLIILICILLLVIPKKKNEPKIITEADNMITDTETPETLIGMDFIEASEQEYYYISENISDFLNALANDGSQAVLQMLDKKFIQENGLSESNIIETLKFSDKYQIYEATKLYKTGLTDNITVYAVSGKIREKEGTNGKQILFDVIMYVDNTTQAFALYPVQGGTLDINKIDRNTLNSSNIELNDCNELQMTVSNQKLRALKIFDKFAMEALYYPEDAYNSLDEEYRNKKFGSLDNFKSFITDNENRFRNYSIQTYNAEYKNGYYEYTVTDSFDNTYIFDVTNYLTYTAKLDLYTIMSEQDVETYNKGSIEEKLNWDIGIFFLMINSKDYYSAYNCLAEGFKNNYFPTLDEFKKYAKENFFEVNELSGITIDNQGDVFMITVDISDSTKQNDAIIRKTIIMQLGEGTDFVMSFNID